MKMRNYYLPLVGAFCLLLISFGSIAEQDPPDEELPGPGLPCASFGYASVGRFINQDFNNINSMLCSCESTGWFSLEHIHTKLCSEVIN